MPEPLIRELLKSYEDSLDGWTEPRGHLVPTEPDPDERARVRADLRAAIATLNRVLEIPPPRLAEPLEWKPRVHGKNTRERERGR